MSRAIQIHALFEEIYGKIAIGYHRTSEQGMKVFTSGGRFHYGFGQAYGPGVYLTYDLKSQLTDQMKVYGEYIIKAKVNLDNFLIFDPEVARKVYPSSPTVGEQLVNVFRIPRDRITKIFGQEVISHLTPSREYYSSRDAQYFINNFSRWVTGNTKGLVFTGATDGKVIVAYHDRSVIPLAYAYVPTSSSKIVFQRLDQYAKETFNYHSAVVNPNEIAREIRKKVADATKVFKPRTVEINVISGGISGQLTRMASVFLTVKNLTNPIVEFALASDKMFNRLKKLFPEQKFSDVIVDSDFDSKTNRWLTKNTYSIMFPQMRALPYFNITF
jgi:hypothetical protein